MSYIPVIKKKDKVEPYKKLPDELIPIMDAQLIKRREKWHLNALEWEDFCQMFREHVCRKYYQFDEKRGIFSHWINGILSRYWINAQRDAGVKHFRPCIANGGCAFALPNGGCRLTKSGVQDCSCKLYRKWYEKKFIAHNITQTLSLEVHTPEVNNQRDENINIDHAKSIIDEKLKERLTRAEYRLYSLLYIKHKEEKDVVALMATFKTKTSTGTAAQRLSELQRKALVLTKEIIAEEGLA